MVGCWSVLDEYQQYSLVELEPGQFREKIVSTFGIGIFFQHSVHNGKFVVSHLNPGSAAAMSKRIFPGDVLFTLNSEKVAGWNWDKLRRKMFGLPGTFVELDFIRKDSVEPENSSLQQARNNWIRLSFRLNHIHQSTASKSSNFLTRWLMQSSVGGEYKMVRINLMRGSPEFCHNASEHGLVQAQQVDLLSKMKHEEEVLCTNIEKRIRLESALFEEVQTPLLRPSHPRSIRESHPVPVDDACCSHFPSAPVPFVLCTHSEVVRARGLGPAKQQVNKRLVKADARRSALRQALADLQAAVAAGERELEAELAQASAQPGDEWYHLAAHAPPSLSRFSGAAPRSADSARAGPKGLSGQLVYSDDLQPMFTA